MQKEPITPPLAEMQAVFLHKLCSSGNISAAARAAGRARSGFYRDRRKDPVFASAWAEALEEAADRLELEAVRRAVDGVSEQRFYQGEEIGSVTRYSDNLLMFLLKARRPWRFDPAFRGKKPHEELNDATIRGQINGAIVKATTIISPRIIMPTEAGGPFHTMAQNREVTGEKLIATGNILRIGPLSVAREAFSVPTNGGASLSIPGEDPQNNLVYLAGDPASYDPAQTVAVGGVNDIQARFYAIAPHIKVEWDYRPDLSLGHFLHMAWPTFGFDVRKADGNYQSVWSGLNFNMQRQRKRYTDNEMVASMRHMVLLKGEINVKIDLETEGNQTSRMPQHRRTTRFHYAADFNPIIKPERLPPRHRGLFLRMEFDFQTTGLLETDLMQHIRENIEFSAATLE